MFMLPDHAGRHDGQRPATPHAPVSVRHLDSLVSTRAGTPRMLVSVHKRIE